MLSALVLVACLGPLHGADPPPAVDGGLRIETSRARVGLAAVYLEVSELASIGGELVGRYRIRVPLSPSKNDTGDIRLAAPGPDYRGTLAGHAYSDDGDVRRSVSCTILGPDTIRIDVVTDARTLSFLTRYAAAGAG